MARLLIIAHAPLASALKAVAAHTFPELAVRVQALDVLPDNTPEQVEAAARALLAQPAGVVVNSAPASSVATASAAASATPGEAGAGDVLILTDVFGGTPCNVAQRLADGVQTRVLAGVNVPMLWRALNYAALPLDELLTRSMAGGTQGVLALASTRPQNQAVPPRAYESNQHHHQQ